MDRRDHARASPGSNRANAHDRDIDAAIEHPCDADASVEYLQPRITTEPIGIGALDCGDDTGGGR